MQTGEALGKGLEQGISYGIQNQDVIKKQRSIMLQEWLKNNMLVDSSEKPLDLNRIMQINQDFVQKGQIDGVGKDVFIKPLKQAGNVYIQTGQGQNDFTPAIFGGNPLKSNDKVLPSADVAATKAGAVETAKREADKANPLPARVIERKQDQQQYDERYALSVEKMISPLSASSRAMLGIAGTSNVRADRALKLLKTGMTPEDKNLIVTDLQGIMKGGAPDEIQLKQGMYSSIYQDAIQLLERVSGNPQELDRPEVIAKLKDTVNTLKEVDNKILDDNLGIVSAAVQPWISRHPDQWDRMTKGVRATGVPSSNPSPVSVNPPVQGNPQIPQTQPQMKPMTATNRQTGQKIISYDGGKSWQIAQ